MLRQTRAEALAAIFGEQGKIHEPLRAQLVSLKARTKRDAARMGDDARAVEHHERERMILPVGAIEPSPDVRMRAMREDLAIELRERRLRAHREPDGSQMLIDV